MLTINHENKKPQQLTQEKIERLKLFDVLMDSNNGQQQGTKLHQKIAEKLENVEKLKESMKGSRKHARKKPLNQDQQ